MSDNKDLLTRLFFPRGVAVIGASTRTYTIGNRIIKNLSGMGFSGRIYPVNPRSKTIEGFTAYPDIRHTPGPVDVAHVILKREMVNEAVFACAEKNVKFCIVNTAGFKETGLHGARLETQLTETARQTGIRIFGPNCQGIINTDPAVNAYCNFTFTRPAPGPVSIFSQSGGIGEIINNRLCELGEGLRMYASAGNTCDIQCHEILSYWKDDPATRVIICHLESMDDPAAFETTVRQVTKKKPVFAMLAGINGPAAQAVRFHTGGCIENREQTLAALENAGASVYFDLETMCHAARAAAHLPMMIGTRRRVGIITNTGGAGVIATDELIRAGCSVLPPSQTLQDKLKPFVFPETVIANPLDVLATAGPDQFEGVLSAMLDDPDTDGILLNFITPFFADCEKIAEKSAAIISRSAKPVACVVMTDKTIWRSTLDIFRHAGIPVFDFPENGARALAAVMPGVIN